MMVMMVMSPAAEPFLRFIYFLLPYTSIPKVYLFSFAITITWSAFYSRIWESFRYLSLCVNGWLVHHSFYLFTIYIHIYIITIYIWFVVQHMYVSLTYPFIETLFSTHYHTSLNTASWTVWSRPTTLYDQLWRHVGPTMFVNLTPALPCLVPLCILVIENHM